VDADWLAKEEYVPAVHAVQAVAADAVDA